MESVNITMLVALHAKSFHNRRSVEKSRMCGCFYCLERFEAQEVRQWCSPDENYKEGTTALCPRCGTDSVLADADVKLTQRLLKSMKIVWFGDI